ncbi:hypothetical protein HZB02_01105 [Candidatus Woesearchaeota archaeon]|nr:hypothetical protein [Candidatus Woesearchaeota archaeon]
MEDLAIYVAEKTLSASKSSSSGVDFEYMDGTTKVIVSVKSGLQWGNSSQWRALEYDFKKAQKVLLQSNHVKQVICILGVCYGNAKTTLKRGIIKQVAGQEFWYLLSKDPSFYQEIIKPLGYKAKELNDDFHKKKSMLINKLTKEFLTDFCDTHGNIFWEKVVEYNSGNLRR